MFWTHLPGGFPMEVFGNSPPQHHHHDWGGTVLILTAKFRRLLESMPKNIKAVLSFCLFLSYIPSEGIDKTLTFVFLTTPTHWKWSMVKIVIVRKACLSKGKKGFHTKWKVKVDSTWYDCTGSQCSFSRRQIPKGKQRTHLVIKSLSSHIFWLGKSSWFCMSVWFGEGLTAFASCSGIITANTKGKCWHLQANWITHS